MFLTTEALLLAQIYGWSSLMAITLIVFIAITTSGERHTVFLLLVIFVMCISGVWCIVDARPNVIMELSDRLFESYEGVSPRQCHRVYRMNSIEADAVRWHLHRLVSKHAGNTSEALNYVVQYDEMAGLVCLYKHKTTDAAFAVAPPPINERNCVV